MQSPWSVVGFPALVLPTGLDPAGLPLGLQLVGAPVAEERLIAAALWCERALGRGPMPATARARKAT